ncbi:MAG: PIN domain-containing protein [Gemmatimonadota bacterium]
MNVGVDSSGWIEFFVDGPNAKWFEEAIHDASDLVVPYITVLEVYRYVLRQRGRQDALEAAATMRQGRVVDLDEGLAIEAAELGASLKLPLADSVTRVPAQSLFEYLEGGETLDEFLCQFPSVRREQAVAAIELARESVLADARPA